MSKFMKLKTPSLPSVPKMPTLPSLPLSTPSIPSLPSLPSLHSLPSSDSITTVASETRARLMRSMSSFSHDSEDSEEKEEESTEPPVLEPVYVVLRPLNLTQAPQALFKGVGYAVEDFEYENYLVLQHWGVLIGEHYYHLHIDDATQKISVSMVPFIHAVKGDERHTIKFPIWRTSMTHDERVGIAVGIIKAMGNYSTEAEVDITDAEGKFVTSPEDRERFKMEGRYRKTPLNAVNLFKGKYGAVTNNCIHFTRHYVFDQILTRKKEMKNFSSNIQWLVTKWQDMGCRRGPIELTKFLAGLLCINPFSVTPQRGARVLIKLLSLFLNIDYNHTLDKKLLSDTASTDEALEEVSDATIEEVPEEAKDDHVETVEVSPA